MIARIQRCVDGKQSGVVTKKRGYQVRLNGGHKWLIFSFDAGRAVKTNARLECGLSSVAEVGSDMETNFQGAPFIFFFFSIFFFHKFEVSEPV